MDAFPHSHALHIVGNKNTGKTSLMKFLIEKFAERGLKVGAFKHTSHNHPLDKVGSDSDQLRKAGAFPTSFSTPEGIAAIFQNPEEDARIKLLSRIYWDCDIVLIESFRKAEGPKIALIDSLADAEELDNVIGLVCKNEITSVLPVFRPNDGKLIEFILKHFKLS